MRGYWTHPSLSRDFALLSAAVLFVLFLVSAWVTYSTYEKHTERVAEELEKEAARIERTLASEMENANYLLVALGKQIVLDPNRDLVKLAQVLKSFDNKGYIYTLFCLIDTKGRVIISSNRGILETPVDNSDRDYVIQSTQDPWKMHIGRPVEGRVSGRWIIPVGMGLTDYTGKFIGSLMISIDINTLTERISSMVKRDGISFAIVSRALIPLTQVSDDKNFLTHNFPTQKLVNANLSENPSGLISHGNLLWGTGNYAFYRVSADYPYIILLGSDSHFSDDTVRNILWSRLLQMLAIAILFVLFLWVMRLRMIAPVMEMTAIAGSVAKGNTNINLPKAGAIEIEGLAIQIRRIGEYIDELKRVEEELRNKLLMMRDSREHIEFSSRSRAELLATICQEMQVPLSHIIGCGQALKDQFYGPIENRKYRQYAEDIFNSGNALLDSVREVLTWAKAETDYIELNEKPVDIAAAVSRVIRFMADKMQSERVNVKVSLQDPLPRLIADEFRFQQILSNLLLHLFHYILPEATLLLEVRTTSEHKEKLFLAITITTGKESPYTQSDLIAHAERLINAAPAYIPTHKRAEMLKEKADINIELVKTLVAMHGGYFELTQGDNNVTTATIIFNASRIRFMDAQDK